MLSREDMCGRLPCAAARGGLPSVSRQRSRRRITSTDAANPRGFEEERMRSLRQVVMVAAVLSTGMVAMPYLRAEGVTPLAGTSVDHIGIVVRDIDRTSQAFREIFGAVVPPARELDPMVLRGRLAASKM